MPVTESPVRLRTLIALYRESHYEVVLPDGSSATIRIGAPAPAALAAWIGTDAGGVFLTACNPHSQPQTAERNQRLLADLRRDLAALQCRFLEGNAHVPGASWREPSFFVCGLADPVVDGLMKRHRQNSTVVVSQGDPAFLRLYRPDWRPMIAPATDLDWACD